MEEWNASFPHLGKVPYVAGKSLLKIQERLLELGIEGLYLYRTEKEIEVLEERLK